MNAGDAQTLAQLAHPDFFDHAAEPSGRIEPLDIFAEDDRVVVRARSSVHIWRFSNGRAVEHWCADAIVTRERRKR